MTKSLSYRNQSINSERKLMDWFLYDRDVLRHERVKTLLKFCSLTLQWQSYLKILLIIPRILKA